MYLFVSFYGMLSSTMFLEKQKTALNDYGQNCTVNPLLDDSKFHFFMLKMSEPSTSKKIFLF